MSHKQGGWCLTSENFNLTVASCSVMVIFLSLLWQLPVFFWPNADAERSSWALCLCNKWHAWGVLLQAKNGQSILPVEKKVERCLSRLICGTCNSVITGNSSRISCLPWGHVSKVLHEQNMNLFVRQSLSRFSLCTLHLLSRHIGWRKTWHDSGRLLRFILKSNHIAWLLWEQ